MAHDLSMDARSMLNGSGASTKRLAANSVSDSWSGVLAMLSDGADVDDVLRTFPGLTCDDLHALLAEIETRDEFLARDGSKVFISPDDFYREIMQREDTRRILAALARW